jgi:hypothetical protein
MHYENIILFHNLLEDFLRKHGLDNKYSYILECSKVRSKVELFIKTKDYILRKQYACLYRDVEMKYIKAFRHGEKTVMFLTHFKLHFLAHLTVKFIQWKNRKNI